MARLTLTTRNQPNKDGKYRLTVRVSHKSVSHYILTSVFLTKSQIMPNGVPKKAVLTQYAHILQQYQDRLDKRHWSDADIKEVMRYLTTSTSENSVTLLDAFEKALQASSPASRKNFIIIYRDLKDMLADNPYRSLVDFNYNFLLEFVRHLKKERQSTNVPGLKIKPVTHNGLVNKLRDLRILYNICRRLYPDLNLTNVFEHYKLPKKQAVANRNLSIYKVVRVVLSKPDNHRSVLFRDMFTLSFLLCGMNAADIYEITRESIKDGRLTYRRRKTRSKRSDQALISVAIPKEAKPLLEKAIRLKKEYATPEGFNAALTKGAAPFGKVTMYYARHSFATIAYVDCGMSKEYIAEALNHVDTTYSTTSIYIAKEWSRVDKVQAAVLELYRSVVQLVRRKRRGLWAIHRRRLKFDKVRLATALANPKVKTNMRYTPYQMERLRNKVVPEMTRGQVNAWFEKLEAWGVIGNTSHIPNDPCGSKATSLQ